MLQALYRNKLSKPALAQEVRQDDQMLAQDNQRMAGDRRCGNLSFHFDFPSAHSSDALLKIFI